MESVFYNLVEYFKKNIKKGYSADMLRIALINQGYSRTLIERAFNKAKEELSIEIKQGFSNKILLN